jgi:hypothetical protein
VGKEEGGEEGTNATKLIKGHRKQGDIVTIEIQDVSGIIRMRTTKLLTSCKMMCLRKRVWRGERQIRAERGEVRGTGNTDIKCNVGGMLWQGGGCEANISGTMKGVVGNNASGFQMDMGGRGA